MKKKAFCIIMGLSLCVCMNASHVYAYDFAGNEDEWLSKCSISQETQEEAQACKEFKKYYQGLQSDVESEIGELENQSAKVVDHIDELQKLVNKQNDLLKELDKKVAANEAAISKIAGQIDKLDKDIAVKEKNIEERDKLIKSRMINGQVHIGTNENIEILMGAKDLMDLIRKIEGLQKITDNDQIEIQKIEKEKKALNLDKEEKQRLKQNEEDAKAENEKSKKDQEKLKANREKLLNQYRKQEADLYEKVRNVKADAATLQNNMIHINTSVAQKIDYNKENSTNSGSGGTSHSTSNGLMSPISGGLSAGTWYYPSSFGGGAHLGVDFGVGVGSAIVAPADGIILFAANPYGTYDGYLNHMIGWPLGGANTIMFLTQVSGTTYAVSFAHMAQEDFMVHAGQEVKQGQLLGRTGASGNVSGPHAHVELFNLGNMSVADAINYFNNSGADFSWGCGWSGDRGLSNVCSVSGRTPCRERPEDYWF